MQSRYVEMGNFAQLIADNGSSLSERGRISLSVCVTRKHWSPGRAGLSDEAGHDPIKNGDELMPNLIDDREDREAEADEQQAVFGGRRAALVDGKVDKQDF